MKNKRKGEKSFTLIELLVGMTMFTLILGAIVGILISAIKVERDILKQQQALDQLSFAIEYMGRALRMAKKDDDGNCLTSGYNYQNPGGISSEIKFINHLQEDDCQSFFLDTNTNQLNYDTGINTVDFERFPLTSPDVVVDRLEFEIVGEAGPPDNFQPKVTIFISTSFPLKIDLQTTISQRNLDI